MPVIPHLCLPVAPAQKPVWKEGSVVLRCPSGRVVVESAMVYGTLAVHAAFQDEINTSLVLLSHRPSMIVVMRVTEIDDAIAAAEYLWETCPLAFSAPGELVDKTKIPASVEAWIKSCQQQKRFVR